MQADGSNIPEQAIPEFTAKVELDIEWRNYRIKTVSNREELKQVLALRHEIFYAELLGKKTDTALDLDEFDPICDHLVIYDRKEDLLIGTYRLISSGFSDRFYTQTEFNIDAVLAKPGLKLEMGRACIHANYRDGFTFIALWKGLAGYISRHRVDYLFGCSSIKTVDLQEVAQLCDYFDRHQHSKHDASTMPIGDFVMPDLEAAVTSLQQQPEAERAARDADLKAMAPPLLWAYIDAGAEVIGRPALDTDFKCFDFLTVLHTENLRDDLVRKYKPW